ncbi:Serine/threonine-protein kinase PknD [Actinomadura sp. RB68]|uniref:non-specific serine/threonine protein kinase n=1 Tax=Actinomadura macrotermitis TaxID=2585200 RepID=A0A7K0BUE7_9ACTN|nr:Serine/threonine-protein kinase PknD [Actinomadura macrotermitis]
MWLGHDEALDSQVAIKVLSGSLIDDLDVRNRFLEEARILRRADSDKLVRVHDIGELPDGRPYFVMSYADRGTLADRMRERPLPVSQALVLAEEIAYGVEVINALGVIHRDLKPSNVLFQSTQGGGEKLLIADLGLAKALAHASGAFTLPVGTPGYMSPEQARFGGGLDVRADVYGLGALTYHMLTGRPPGPAPVKVPPSRLREGLTPGFDQVILRALEVEREKRWPTAEAFAEALATLRPTTAPAYDRPGPEGEATVRDQYRGGEPPHQQPQRPPQPPPGEDDMRTSEMAQPQQQRPQPPVPPGGGDATIVDHPANANYAGPGGPRPGGPGGPQGPGSTSPGGPGGPGQGDDERTVSIPLPGGQQPPQGGPPQGGPPPGKKTAVFSPQDHQMPPGGQQGHPGAGFQPPPVQDGRGGGGPAGPSPAQKAKGKLKGFGGGSGGGSSQKSLMPWLIAGGILTVALIAGLLIGSLVTGGDDGPKKPGKTGLPVDFAQIGDASGKIKLSAPKAWGKGTAPTWVPSTVGLADAQARPVLRAAQNVADFPGNGKSPGVFVGVTTDVANGKLPPPSVSAHASCTKGAPENYTSPGKALTGTIVRYTGCKTGTPSITEVGLRDKGGKFGAWVRVKETDGRNLTTSILNSLTITGP